MHRVEVGDIEKHDREDTNCLEKAVGRNMNLEDTAGQGQKQSKENVIKKQKRILLQSKKNIFIDFVM